MPDLDLLVVWDGAHKGANQDLIFIDDRLKVAPSEPVPVTRAPVMTRGRSTTRRGMQADSGAAEILRLLERTGEALTSVEITKRIQLDRVTVRSALFNLRRRHLVAPCGIKASAGWGRSAWRYRAVLSGIEGAAWG